jgi:hypothetical protein
MSEEGQTYAEWLWKHDPQAARWLERLEAINTELSKLDAHSLQHMCDSLVKGFEQEGKVILDANTDAKLIYELNKQSHSMQAPFCDTSGYGMNMPKKYVVLGGDLTSRVKQLIVTIEYPLYYPNGR